MGARWAKGVSGRSGGGERAACNGCQAHHPLQLQPTSAPDCTRADPTELAIPTRMCAGGKCVELGLTDGDALAGSDTTLGKLEPMGFHPEWFSGVITR
jgi:hypothetical protein